MREFLLLVLSSLLSAASSQSSSLAFVCSVVGVFGHLAVDRAFCCSYACIIILFPILCQHMNNKELNYHHYRHYLLYSSLVS